MPNGDAGLEYRYKMYMSQVQDWANKHKISLESAVSILHDDSPRAPFGPKEESITYHGLFGWVECNTFYTMYRKNHPKV